MSALAGRNDMSDSIDAVRTAVAGRYEIDREIGEGAFAKVYLARDLKHDRPVAFKVLKADASFENSELRFLREIRVLARLQHPHVLPLIDSGHAQEFLYYVMPYVKGESLRQRINRERQLSVDAAVLIALEASDALACAHEQNIIHRDIKPENILLSAGHAIIADFGIARAIDVAGVRSLTRTGSASPGTPAYMSPEQLLNDAEIDARSDIYSLGCVLFEMLTGTVPFVGREGLVKRVIEPPPRPSTLRQELPPEIDDIVYKAMARESSERFQTARDFNAAIAATSRAGGSAVAIREGHAPQLSGDEEARDSFLIARRIIQRRSHRDYPIAERELVNALRRDPGFAAAYALDGVLCLLRVGSDISLQDGVDNGRKAAESAILIDPCSSDAHAVLGLCATLAWEWDAASASFETATLGETTPLALHWYALYSCARGETERAQTMLTEAIALDNGNANLRAALGLAAFYHGDGESAIISLQRACALEPANPLFPALLGMAHAFVREFDKAMARYSQAVELAGKVDTMMLAARTWTLSRAGRQQDASREYSAFTAACQTTDVSPFLEAAVSTSVDRLDAAIDALRRAVLERDGWLLSLRVHPWMEPLRGLEGFQNIVSHIGV